MMREFADNEGVRWQVALTVGSALRVRDLVRIVSGDPPEEKPFDIIDAAQITTTFQALRTNYAAVGETLYALLLPQIEKRDFTREQFLDRLSGDSLEAGGRAIEEEIVGFFPPRLRGMIASLSTKMTQLTEAVTEKAMREMEEIDPSGLPSGPSPESSESTPETGPSDN